MVSSKGFGFDSFTDDILQYLDEHHIETINLFGYSMGGYAALLFASKYPNRVEKIFTLNVKFRWDLESTVKETNFLNPDKMLEKVPGFANNLILQHGMNLWKNMLHQTSQMMLDMSETNLLTDEKIKLITHPSLLAVGELDTTSSLEETIAMKNKLKDASLLVIPATPHAFEKISIERLVFEINSFLR
jgi:pimeloyl-ACP methyl ester carboxylesterase